MYRLGSNYQTTKDYQKSVEANDEALNIFLKSDTKVSWLPKVYFKIGTNYLFLKNFDSAKEFFEKTVASSLHPIHQSYSIESLNYLGYIYQIEGDYQLALKKIEQALLIAKRTGENAFMADSWKEKGNIQSALGDYEKALVSLQIAAKLTKPNQIQDLGRIYDIIGRTFAKINKTDLAIKNYELALKILTNSDSLLSASINISLGNLYSINLKKYDKALINFVVASKLTNDSYQKMGIYNNIGYVFLQKKDFNATFHNYQLAYKEIFENFNEKSPISNPSLESVKRAIRKKNILTLTKDKADAWLEYYKFNKDKKNLQNALKTYLLADNIMDFMRWEQTGDENKLFWRKKTRPIYENAIETCYLLEDYEKAFYFFEKSRAVLLNDKLNELGAKQSLSEQDKKKENELQSKIDELRKKLTENKNDIEKTEKDLFLAENEQEKFIKTLETKNPAYYQLKYDNTNITLKQFQTYLTPSGGRGLEFFIGDSATYAMIISPNSVSLKKLNFKASLAKNFLNLCSKNLSTKTEFNDFLSVSSALYQSLIAPLNIPKGRLIISQDGAFLPFEALSKSATKADFILNDYAISYTYSAQFLLKNKKNYGFLPQNTFLGVAPVSFANFAQKLNSLNGSDASIDKIASYFWFSDKLNQQKATKKAFLQEAQKYQIVQLYTHAFADTLETEPRIYFADSSLKITELGTQTQFKTNLLVLTACKTGIGKVAKGEGVLSLARGFSMAGIPSTITTLWSVEDQTTYQITELFYEFLSKDLSRDEALQQAKIKFIGQNQNLSPSQWSGIILIGDASALEKSNFLWWILGGIMVLGLVWWVLRKQMEF